MQRLYYGGDIVTMAAEGDTKEALLVEDGIIRFTGRLVEAKKLCAEEAEEIDLCGRTLMPSFIDGHSHISMYAQFSSFPDVSGCTSFGEIVEYLTEYLTEHPMTGEDVLFATGYDHNFLVEERHPTREVLDRVSDVIPVFLLHSSGHMGVASTKLLAQSGVALDAKDPDGGRYGRYEDGTLNGYAEEPAAFGPILRNVFGRLQMDPVKQIRDVQEIYLKYGVTTVQDGGTSRRVLDGLLQMAQAGMFQVDIVSYPMFDEKPEETLRQHEEYARHYKNHLKIAGAKIFLDGSPQGKSAWLTKPYEGEESYRGYPTQEDAVVEAAAENAISHGYQLLAHCNGDAACGQYIRCYKKALAATRSGGADLRPVMIHAQMVQDDQLRAMSEIGMLPSIFVAHTYYWGDVHLKNLGLVRGARISPVQSAMACGLKYNFHQDCPVLPPDMMRTVWCAVNRVTRRGVKIGQEQCVGVFEALKGVTINAAYAYHEEGRKGSLEEGKLADMIILEENPLRVDPGKLADIKVTETIKEGKTLYQRAD